MKSQSHAARRKVLFIVLFFLSLAIFLTAFFILSGNLAINDDDMVNEGWAVCDLSGMRSGDFKECGWGSVVYKRTDRDINAIDEYYGLLADPMSLLSNQPDAAKNEWRSENKKCFVFLPFAPIRGCELNFKLPGRDINPQWPEAAALFELPYLSESCEGRAWDMSGRLYKREGYPDELNVTVPNFQWQSEFEVIIRSN